MNKQTRGAGAATICFDPPAGVAANTTIAIDDVHLLAMLRNCISRGPNSRRRVAFPALLEQSFGTLAAFQSSQEGLQCCYSVKTNPAASVLVQAKRSGLFAEVISAAEFDRAMKCGFSPDQTVYNGPVPVLACRQAPGLIFADSVEGYLTAIARFPQSLIGIRVRPPGIASHFGLPAQDMDAFAALVQRSGRSELAVSYHVRPQDYGTYSFTSLAATAIRCAMTLEQKSATRITAFDIGGGWQPAELDAAISGGDLVWILVQTRQMLPHVRRIFCEPGQALVTSCEALIAPILEVRSRNDRIGQIVVDAGYPDVPQIHSFAHRLFLVDDGKVTAISPGAGTIVGRTCLEYDLISDSSDLQACRTGAAILIADVGAYDSSMHFTFAQGQAMDQTAP